VPPEGRLRNRLGAGVYRVRQVGLVINTFVAIAERFDRHPRETEAFCAQAETGATPMQF
jgi:hypothetical protein